MKSKTATRRAMLLSLTSLLICAAMLVGTTYAWFTDSVTSGTNRIIAGNLDVELTHENNGTNGAKPVEGSTELFKTAFGGAMLWEPGAAAYETFTVSNVGSLALKYQLNLSNIIYNSVTWANDPNVYNLPQVIKIGVVSGTVTRDAIKAASLQTMASVMESNAWAAKTGALEPGASESFTVALYWAPDNNEIDNHYNLNNTGWTLQLAGAVNEPNNALFIDSKITLLATQQTSESDSFDYLYDAGATADGGATIVPTTASTTANVTGDANANKTATLTAAVAPVENMNTKVTLTNAATDGALDSATSAKLDVETTDIDVTSATSYSVVADASSVATIDLTLTVTKTVGTDTTTSTATSGFTAAVETYIAPGLSSVTVNYNGASGTFAGNTAPATAVTSDAVPSGAHVGDSYYNTETGYLAFVTDHFSQYVASTTDQVYDLTAKKGYSLGDFRDKWNDGTITAANLLLLKDVDLNNAAWTPIGTKDHPFKGVFDGNGKTISNFTVSGINYYAALFGYAEGEPNSSYNSYSDILTGNALNETNIAESKYQVVFKNINVSGANCSSVKKFAAALIAFANNAYISNVAVSGSTISTGKVAGGIAATLNGSVVKGCTVSNSAISTTGYHTGGVVGYMSYPNDDSQYPTPNMPSAIISCTNNTAINDANQADNGGGFAGIVAGVNATHTTGVGSVVVSCTNNGAITIDNTALPNQYYSQVGGIVASGQGIARLVNCTNNGAIVLKSAYTGDNSNKVGGIISSMGNLLADMGILHCANKGNISATVSSDAIYVGGIAASLKSNTNSAFIDGCENSGAISCKDSSENSRGKTSAILAQVDAFSNAVVYKNMSFADLAKLSAALPKDVHGEGNNKIIVDSSVAVADKSGVLEISGQVRRIDAYDGLCTQFKITGATLGTSGDTRSAYLNIPNAKLLIDANETYTTSVTRFEGDGMGIINNGTYNGGAEFYCDNVAVENNGTFNANNGNQITFHGDSGTVSGGGTYGANFGVQFYHAGTFTVSGIIPYADNDKFTVTHEGSVYTVTEN